MVKIMAIDPGQNGGYAFQGKWTWEHEPLRYNGNTIDVEWLQKTLITLYPDVVIIEEQQRQRITTLNEGMMIATALLCDLEVCHVHPTTWKTALELNGKGKQGSIGYCQEHSFPLYNRGKRKVIYHDGIADSWCMIDWYKRFRKGD